MLHFGKYDCEDFYYKGRIRLVECRWSINLHHKECGYSHDRMAAFCSFHRLQSLRINHFKIVNFTSTEGNEDGGRLRRLDLDSLTPYACSCAILSPRRSMGHKVGVHQSIELREDRARPEESLMVSPPMISTLGSGHEQSLNIAAVESPFRQKWHGWRNIC